MNEFRHGLDACERLKASDINRLFQSGVFTGVRLLNIRALPNGLEYNRIGIAVSRKSGKANRRNRVRRRLKAAYQKIKPELVKGFDLVIIARYGVDTAEFTQLCTQLQKAYAKACPLEDRNAQENPQNPGRAVHSGN